MKAHLVPGVVVISDMHSMYVSRLTNVSSLSCFGWYHMWTNHSEMFVHKKFTFVHSMNIERKWLDMKKMYPTMTNCRDAKRLQDWCNLYTMQRSIVKSQHQYHFWLKLLNYYFRESSSELHLKGILDENCWPNILCIEEIRQDIFSKTAA